MNAHAYDTALARPARPALTFLRGRVTSTAPSDKPVGPTGDARLESLRRQALPVGAPVGAAVGCPVAP